ncbi:hypothetical protein [Geoglobus acetivorans]|uniref:hypothetical protein n=1 Tax=Geoglobus acetivorans TaxID=565033 RepID=UPI00064FECD6
MRRQHTDFAVLLALFVVLELLLDALAGDWLRQVVQQYLGTVPAALGFVAVLALIYVRVSKYEALAGLSGGKKKGGKKRKR